MQKVTLDEFKARIAIELRVWGWCVTGAAVDKIDARAASRSSSVAVLVERRDDTLSGWWDHNIAQLWTIRVDRGLGTDRPPFWYALAGLAWADRAWWLEGAQ